MAGTIRNLCCDEYHDGFRVVWDGHHFADNEGISYHLQVHLFNVHTMYFYVHCMYYHNKRQLGASNYIKQHLHVDLSAFSAFHIRTLQQKGECGSLVVIARTFY